MWHFISFAFVHNFCLLFMIIYDVSRDSMLNSAVAISSTSAVRRGEDRQNIYCEHVSALWFMAPCPCLLGNYFSRSSVISVWSNVSTLNTDTHQATALDCRHQWYSSITLNIAVQCNYLWWDTCHSINCLIVAVEGCHHHHHQPGSHGECRECGASSPWQTGKFWLN